MRMKILVACEFSGVVSNAFEAKGHDVWSCDMLPSERGHKHYQGDVREVLCDGWDLMVAHPPCTRLTNAGVRWLHEPPQGKTLDEMWAALYDDVGFYRLLRDAPIKKKCIENPIMHKYARWMARPGKRQIVQPWWFGDPAFKATGFELIGLPDLVPTNKLTPPEKGTQAHKDWSMIHRASPGPERAKERSRTFPGIALAMAEQWGNVA